MPPKGKPKKKQQKQAVTVRSDDSETFPARENVPEDSSVSHQLFSSLPKKVRKVVYGQLDMRTAHSASLASSEIHEYFTEHPFKVDKIEFCLAGDSDDCQTITIRYPTENYTESHCRAFKALPQQLTVSMEKSTLQLHQAKARRFRHMFAMHKMHLDPATVLHGLQMTEAEDITVDLLTLLCCSPRDVAPISHPPKQLLLYWEKRKKKVAEVRNNSSGLEKVTPGLGDLTEGQILQGIQAWIDFVRPTEQVILQVEDRSIAIPSGFFGLPGIKAAKGLMTQVLNKNANEDDEKVVRERPFVLVNVTLKQIRKLSATKLLLGLAPRISSDEVIQYFVEKVNYWVRDPDAYLHFCFARSPDDKAYNEENIIRELNLARLAPRFTVHRAQNLRMEGSMTAGEFYGGGTIIQDMESPRALFLGCGPRIFALDEGECGEIMWKVKSQKKPAAQTKRFLMPVPGWPTEFKEFRNLPKRVLHTVCSHIGFADAQVLCAVYPKANEYFREHPFAVERVRFEYAPAKIFMLTPCPMTDSSTFLSMYIPQMRFEKHERRNVYFRDTHRVGKYSVELGEEHHPKHTFKGVGFKHDMFFNMSLIFEGLSRVAAHTMFINFLSILSASPPMEMAPHVRPPEVLTLVFEVLRTESTSFLHMTGEPVGMTRADLCMQPEKTIEGVRRWLHFIQPTVKVVFRLENRRMKLPSAIFDLPEVCAANGLVTELDERGDGTIFDLQVDVTIAQVRALSATYIFLGYTPRITNAEVFSYIVDKAKAWLLDRDLFKKYNFCFARRMNDMRELGYASEVITKLQIGNRFRVHEMRTVWPGGSSCYGFGGKLIQDTQCRRALLVGCGPGPKIHSLTDEQLQEVNWRAKASTSARRGAMSGQGAAMEACINQ